MSSILQWRRLSAKRKDDGTLCESSCKNEGGVVKGANADEGFIPTPSGITNEPKRKNLDDDRDIRRASRPSIDNKMHIVQCKKAQYSHLMSSHKVMPKDEDDDYPKVYETRKSSGKKEPAALWLASFRVDED